MSQNMTWKTVWINKNNNYLRQNEVETTIIQHGSEYDVRKSPERITYSFLYKQTKTFKNKKNIKKHKKKFFFLKKMEIGPKWSKEFGQKKNFIKKIPKTKKNF